MTTYYSAEATLLQNTTPRKMPDGNAYGGRLRRYRATVTLASQTTSDTIVLAEIPAGAVFAYGVLNTTVSLGSSTVAIGITGTTGKYRAAAAFTATDTPTLFGVNAAVAAGPLTAAETVFITIGGATMPSSGTLIVDLYYSQV